MRVHGATVHFVSDAIDAGGIIAAGGGRLCRATTKRRCRRRVLEQEHRPAAARGRARRSRTCPLARWPRAYDAVPRRRPGACSPHEARGRSGEQCRGGRRPTAPPRAPRGRARPALPPRKPRRTSAPAGSGAGHAHARDDVVDRRRAGAGAGAILRFRRSRRCADVALLPRSARLGEVAIAAWSRK